MNAVAILLLLFTADRTNGSANSQAFPLNHQAFVPLVPATAHLVNYGSLWGWGSDENGKLGNGMTVYSVTVPVRASGLGNVTRVSAGSSDTVALTVLGAVWASGDNHYGQLGNGTTMASTVPVQVNALDHVAAIASGYEHNLAVKADGSLWGWGENYFGELGNGATDRSGCYCEQTVVQVVGLSGVRAIAAGWEHSLALISDGTVWAWGSNNYGQLGNGTIVNSSIPVKVGVDHVTSVSAGFFHSLALRQDGTVWAWGWNYFGVLGVGSTVITSSVPLMVTGLTNVVSIAANGYESFAIRSDGTLWGWGSNNFGQLGNGTTADSDFPVEVTGLTGVVAVAPDYSHALALRSDGTVWSWGQNMVGELGAPTTQICGWDNSPCSTIPIQAKNVNNALTVAAGGADSFAIVP